MRGRFILKTIQTSLQQELSVFPTQLEFLRVLNFRGSDYFQEQKKLYRSLDAGDVGERRVLEYLEEFGSRGWVVLRNVWLNDFGTFECDVILITRYCVYVFEIKNYTGLFAYDEGKCYVEKMETSLNPIEQCRRNVVNLRNILRMSFPSLPIKAATLFAGIDNDVQILSAVSDIDIRNSTQLRRFVLDILNEERQSPPHRIPFEKIIAALECVEIVNPYMPQTLTADEFQHIRGGINCASCQSFEVTISKFKVVCSCGLTESREEAIIRAVCDYGVLNYGSNLVRKELVEFFDGQISSNLLKKVMDKHFSLKKNARYTHWINKNLSFDRISHSFVLKHPKIFTFMGNS